MHSDVPKGARRVSNGRCPSINNVFYDPEPDVAALNQPAIIFVPVQDLAFGFVNRMAARRIILVGHAILENRLRKMFYATCDLSMHQNR